MIIFTLHLFSELQKIFVFHHMGSKLRSEYIMQFYIIEGHTLSFTRFLTFFTSTGFDEDLAYPLEFMHELTHNGISKISLFFVPFYNIAILLNVRFWQATTLKTGDFLPDYNSIITTTMFTIKCVANCFIIIFSFLSYGYINIIILLLILQYDSSPKNQILGYIILKRFFLNLLFIQTSILCAQPAATSIVDKQILKTEPNKISLNLHSL
ncbi:hypothetical protein ACJX0J_006566 [Zea mays]